MSKVLSPRELKRLSREMAGHARDKDRARRRRRASGAANAAGRPPQKGRPAPEPEDEPLDEAEGTPVDAPTGLALVVAGTDPRGRTMNPGEGMSTAVRAIFEDGVFKPEEAVPLKDKTRVQLVISSAPEPASDDDPTGWTALD